MHRYRLQSQRIFIYFLWFSNKKLVKFIITHINTHYFGVLYGLIQSPFTKSKKTL